MTLTLRMPEERDLRPRITVFGVGGAGGNAVNNMIDKELDGVEFVVANTDAQALRQSKSTRRIQLGQEVTQGLGAGAKPEVGSSAAVESIEEIVDHLAGSHMCFITAGMGGGTGTGAAPIIAKTAREMGILTVGVVTKPFTFEGTKRMRTAESGIAELQAVVDTLIIIPNQNLFRLANERTTFTEAFLMADDVLYQGVKGVTDLMVRPGIINLDFADVRSVMDEMGKAMMGTGEASGDDRAVQAAEKAIANPLLDEISLRGARGVLINITGGDDLTLFELDEAANRIRAEVDPDANIIIGSTLDPDMNGVMRVSVVATGIDAVARSEERPTARSTMSAASHIRPRPADDWAERVAVPAAAVPEAPAPAPAPAPVVSAPEVQAAAALNAFIPPQNPLAEEEREDMRHEAPAFRPEPEHAGQRGEPTAETLRRLQAAVSKIPSDGMRPAAPAPAAARAAPLSEERGALNRLIHRMTGQQPGREVPERRQPEVTERRAPDAPQAPRRLSDDEQSRIDIPAFLRRQAN